MGFSLRRALAGAVAGGAGAAVELADGAMKAAEIDRQKQIEFDRQKELLRIQDENAINRIEHVEKFKDKREADRAERFGTFLSETTKGLKADGVKPESAEGQARIAQALLEKGYPKEGNWFQDNSFKMMQLKSNDDLRRAEMAGKYELARLGRESRGAKDEDKDEQRILSYAGIAGRTVKATDREGNTAVVSDAANQLAALALDLRDAGMSNHDIRRAMSDTASAMNLAIAKNPKDPMAGVFSTTQFVRSKLKLDGSSSAESTTQTQAPAQNQPAPSPKSQPYVPPAIGSGRPALDPANLTNIGSYTEERTSAAGIKSPESRVVVGSKPMSRTFGDDLVDAVGDGAAALTGSGADWSQVSGGGILRPRSAR